MALQSISHLFSTKHLQVPLILKEELVLCENNNLIFHWADFKETCELVKHKLNDDHQLQTAFHQKQMNIDHLRLIPVWFRTQKKVYHMSVFDLYERFILNKPLIFGGVDPFDPLEVSFISSTGPFKSISIAECFNKETYRDFILVYLIKDRLPKRDFRLRLRSKVLIEYGKEFAEARLINLEQMTASGLLFSVGSDFFMKDLSKKSKVRILLDTDFIGQAIGKDLSDLKAHLSQRAFNLLYSSSKEDAIECNLTSFSSHSSFDFFSNKKVYLFITFDALSAHRQESAEVLKRFIDHSKNLVRDYYQVGRKIQKSA
jgi:hypothetical protein